MVKKGESEKSKILYPILNRLKNRSLRHDDLLGIICFMLYNKYIFEHNKDIVPFLSEVFNEKYLDYVIKSRTLIVARITKFVYLMEEKEKSDVPLKIVKYFEINQATDEKVSDKKNNKKQNANEKLQKWLKGL